MAKLISKTYGEALFNLAVEQNKMDAFYEEVQVVQKSIQDNPEFSKLMNHPKILKEEKTDVMTKVFKGRISDEILGFLILIITKDRYGKIQEILDYFINEVKSYKGIGIAFVTTATEINQAKQKEIEEKLLATTSFNKMEMHYNVDESLIGGMTIRIGDRVVDSSIKTKLEELERQLLKVQI